MDGTVVELKRKGVLVETDSLATDVAVGTRFRIYRVVDGTETEVGTGVSKVAKGPNLLKVNPEPDVAFGEPRLGDLVRSV